MATESRAFLAVAGGNFLLFFAFYLLLPVLPMYLMEQFGSNKATVGVILSSYTITALFVRPFAGYMVDTFPRKPLQLICYGVFTLFKATSDFLNREYPGNTFMTAHFDHSIATAIWRLDGQADNLLDTYHREIAAKGLQTEKMVPALRFSTSDVGMSGANLYPIFLVGAESRIVPLGYSIRTEHKNGVDMQYFEEQLRLVYAQFEKALDKQVQLMNIEIRYPVTTLMRVLKRIKAPKKASYEAMDYFVAIHGDSPCTAYELFMQMSDVIFSAQCDGASGLRIAQLEEIVSRALNVNCH